MVLISCHGDGDVERVERSDTGSFFTLVFVSNAKFCIYS